MESLLLFIKHRLSIVWMILEWINNIAFSVLYKSKLDKINKDVIASVNSQHYIYKRLNLLHIDRLYHLIHNQKETDLTYFKAHGFSHSTLRHLVVKSSFLMMGVFSGENLIGYFFLRLFANKKCFVGRLIDKEYRGKGIGENMNNIMYETAWKMGFRCLSTISRKNTAIMVSHSRNKHMIIVKELKNDYLLVEFVRESK